MKKKIRVAALLSLLLCVVFTASALAVTYGTVHGGWLRLRSAPSYSASVITSYRNGTVVTVLSQESGWARVLTADYRIGYMDARYLTISGSPYPQPTAAPTAVPYSRIWTDVNRTAYVTSANGKGVRMRSTPEVNKNNVMGLYPVGRTAFEIRRSNDGWSYIRIDAKYGYMMSQFLTGGYVPVPTATYVPWIPTPTPTLTPTPTPPPTPTPEPLADFRFRGINPWQPKVGDTVKAVYEPANAQVTVVWYDGSTGEYLGTGTSCTVKSAQAGHTLKYHVVGAGAYAMVAVDGESAAVQP